MVELLGSVWRGPVVVVGSAPVFAGLFYLLRKRFQVARNARARALAA